MRVSGHELGEYNADHNRANGLSTQTLLALIYITGANCRLEDDL
jgi:hypothetical protein